MLNIPNNGKDLASFFKKRGASTSPGPGGTTKISVGNSHMVVSSTSKQLDKGTLHRVIKWAKAVGLLVVLIMLKDPLMNLLTSLM